MKPAHDIQGMTVFNSNPVDTTTQPMFFGQPLGMQRYDVTKYPVFYKLTQQQIGAFWRPEAYPITKDKADFINLRPEQKHIFTSNLKYQIMLDSVQGRGASLSFLPYCSLPELESAMIAWQFMEMIHSYSYTYIIKNVYSNQAQGEIFNSIVLDENILERASSVTTAYDEFINSAQQYGTSNLWKFNNEGVELAKTELYEVKRKLYRAIMNVNILEGIRFYVSFACSFAFGELHLMEGSAKIISKIAHDEALHLFLTQNIISKWKKGDDPDMVKIAKEEEGWTYNIFKQVSEEEKRWAKYLFKDGSMIGLNEKLLGDYVEWIGCRRMRALSYHCPYTVSQSNPLPWTEKWIGGGAVQVAPQETEITSYITGGVKQDVTAESMKGLSL